MCQRVGAKATFEGSISSLGSDYVVTIGVHNCQTGAALAEQQVQVRTKEEVLSSLGKATTALRQSLGESLASIQKYDVPVTEATTSSLEALKAYGLANKTRYTRGEEASIPFFQKAVEIDPDFALGYAKLAVVFSNIGRNDDSRMYAQKAYDMKDRVSEYERLYITWNYDTKVLQDSKKTRETLELMTASYPRDYAAQNNLGVYYISRDEFSQAAEHYRAAIDIAPDEPLPMSNLAYALFFLNQRPEAYTWTEKSLAIRPLGDLAVTRWFVARLYGDPEQSAFEAAARKIASPDQILSAEATLAAWDGRLKDYGRIEEELRARARAAHDEGTRQRARGVRTDRDGRVPARPGDRHAQGVARQDRERAGPGTSRGSARGARHRRAAAARDRTSRSAGQTGSGGLGSGGGRKGLRASRRRTAERSGQRPSGDAHGESARARDQLSHRPHSRRMQAIWTGPNPATGRSPMPRASSASAPSSPGHVGSSRKS